MPYFVIEVFSSKEEETARRIKNDLREITDDIDIFVPKRKRIIKKEGISKEKIEVLFPGYIFIECTDIDIINLKKNLYQVKTLTKLLGLDKEHKDYVSSLSIEEEEMLNLLLGKENKNRTVEISHIYLRENKEVVVIDGPLKGLEGRISNINLHKRRVTILTQFMGRMVESELGIDFVAEKSDSKEN